MKTLIYTCDLCGADRLLKDDVRAYSVKNVPLEEAWFQLNGDMRQGIPSKPVPDREYHLCVDCFDHIKKAIRERGPQRRRS